MAADNSNKKHVSVVVAGHVDSGKSTSTGHLLFALGGISTREMDKLKEEAKALGKDSFAFAFYLDKQKEERARGITITCATKEFFTDNYHYTIIDAPGHRDFIKNMISGASQADVAMLMVPADGGFTTAIAKGNPKAGEIQGQTRQHARLLMLLGVKQLVVCVNKMDAAEYSQEKFNEIAEEMRNMLKSVGWPKEFVEKNVPILPISGWHGDNLVKESDKMPWWKGFNDKHKTVVDVLDKFVTLPKRNGDGVLRGPVNGVYKIKGVGDVITTRIEQGTLRPGDTIKFLPSGASGKVFTIEMHHKQVAEALPGDNVGLNVKGLAKEKMPKTGDIIVLESDNTLQVVKRFTAQVQIMDTPPNPLKPGYSPIGFVRTSHSPIKLDKIRWRKGKDTAGQQVKDPVEIKANDMAECEFVPTMPFVVDKFGNCEGLGRIAALDGNTVVLLGRITEVEH